MDKSRIVNTVACVLSGSIGLVAMAVLRLDYFFPYAVDKPKFSYGILSVLLGLSAAWLTKPRTPIRAAMTVLLSLGLVAIVFYLFLVLSPNSCLNIFRNSDFERWP